MVPTQGRCDKLAPCVTPLQLWLIGKIHNHMSETAWEHIWLTKTSVESGKGGKTEAFTTLPCVEDTIQNYLISKRT